MKNELDFLKEKIENSGVKAPEDMDENYVLKTIENVYPKPAPVPKKKRVWKTVAISAAAFVFVAIIGVVVGMYIFQQNAIGGKTVSLPGGLSLKQFQSHAQLKVQIDKMRSEREKSNLINGVTDYLYGNYSAGLDYYMAEDSLAPESGSSNTGSSKTGSADGAFSSSHSETYKQVDGVDEADIIKTDGRYIYCVSGSNVVIFSADGENSRKVAVLSSSTQTAATADEAEYRDDFDYEGYYGMRYISDIYLKDGRLVVLCDDQGDTMVQVYDVSDINNITLLDSMTQSGYYNSSRMIGDTLYTVTSYYVYDDNYIPCCGESASPDQIPADCIYAVKDPVSEDFLIVSAYDTVNYDAQTESKAVFGGAQDIYCNLENMYIYSTDYSYSYENYWDGGYYANSAKSRILKVDLTDGISFTAYTEIDGYIDDQYALDEYNGNLRVATTSYENDRDVNNLFVLDENLNTIGSVTGFAENESIKAVRYMGDTAYVITYEQTDPLFVIDLSDPASPAILGEVKISGFSTMLVPIDENTILGLGYHTEEEDYIDIEVQEGFKLAIFDVSDKANPQVLDSVSFVDYDSSVQYDPKALVYNPDRNDYVIPLNYHHYEYIYDDDYYYDSRYEYRGGMLNFKVENGKLNIISQYKADYEDDVERCVYIDDTVYMTHGSYYGDGIKIDSVKYQ